MNLIQRLTTGAVLVGLYYAIPTHGQTKPEIQFPVYSTIKEDSTLYLISDQDSRKINIPIPLLEGRLNLSLGGPNFTLTSSSYRPQEQDISKRLRKIAQFVEDKGTCISDQGFLGHTKEISFKSRGKRYIVTFFNINENCPYYENIMANPPFDMLSIEQTNEEGYVGMSFIGLTGNITGLDIKGKKGNRLQVVTEEDKSMIRDKKAKMIEEVYDSLVTGSEKVNHGQLEEVLGQ